MTGGKHSGIVFNNFVINDKKFYFTYVILYPEFFPGVISFFKPY